MVDGAKGLIHPTSGPVGWGKVRLVSLADVPYMGYILVYGRVGSDISRLGGPSEGASD